MPVVIGDQRPSSVRAVTVATGWRARHGRAMTDPAIEPIPAATVIVMRDLNGQAPQLLMVERARAMRFAGGALVFPGGRVDPGDRVAGALFAGEADDMAARVAAIREALEEAGVAIGIDGLDPHRLAAARAASHDGDAVLDALASVGATLDPQALVPWARWCPHHKLVRVFDTRFYLARWDEDHAPPVVDGTENTRSFWASAAEILASADRGEARLIFPTRRNLERLALFGSFDEAMTHARAHPVRKIVPWIEVRGGTDHLCIPDDLGYPVTAVPMEDADRA